MAGVHGRSMISKQRYLHIYICPGRHHVNWSGKTQKWGTARYQQVNACGLCLELHRRGQHPRRNSFLRKQHQYCGTTSRPHVVTYQGCNTTQGVRDLSRDEIHQAMSLRCLGMFYSSRAICDACVTNLRSQNASARNTFCTPR